MEDILISLLPIIIIVFVWIFLMRYLKKHSKNNKFEQNQVEMIGLLKEIKDELKQLNQKDTPK